ncbi:MAG: EamA family transporter [Saprospiraceae bacterium]|nr:EamA family transporter [Saprospiraceae bacterium]
MPDIVDVVQSQWFVLASLLGFVFISGFYLFGIAIQWWGIAIVSAFQKMSLLLSVLFAMLYYKENPTFFQIMGILLGLLAIPFLLHRKEAHKWQQKVSVLAYFIVLGTFLISGTIEILLMVVERSLSTRSGDPVFIATIFGVAFISGFPIMLSSKIERIAFFSKKHLMAGWLLGVPNFFSIYFLMRSLGSSLPSSLVIPFINTGTILVSVLAGVILFKEDFTIKNVIGLVMAIGAMMMLTLI